MENNKFIVDNIIDFGFLTKEEKMHVMAVVERLLPYVWKYCPGIITASDVVSMGVVALSEKGNSLETIEKKIIEACAEVDKQEGATIGDLVYKIIRE